ncbi:hypothetical protein P171DRAFT_478581 [Karstenula rhodostoma CBS 690.94]|uniref:Uncharacterized protein n=1 Tax=Karstenula rhodostoma CBS 690.94 TaxID=1392251 RepID=A0A9P4PWG9_9PLEO|nr:hypothetical protein P171DRAFT_478581 [Karstenula rhodostoma CBS 690.94]
MPEPSWPAPILHSADLLFKLPRELRDKVYADALDAHCPVGLTEDLLPHIPPILRENPSLLPEILEVLTRLKTFNLNCDDPHAAVLKSPRVCVNPYEVRHLNITCTEYASILDHADFEDLEEHEKIYQRTVSRCDWERLLDFPRLQDLAIYMQKREDNSLNTFDFGPVLYSLRAKLPQIKITFFLSFDTILRNLWDDPRWNNGDISADTPPYRPMGFVDMSDLVAPSTDEDLNYLLEHLSDYVHTGRMPGNRCIGTGLLDESPANRRALAKHYAVKEPALLRCLMRDHFEVYRKQQNGIPEGEST